MDSKNSGTKPASPKREKSPLAHLSPLECLEIAYQMVKIPGILVYRYPRAARNPSHAHKKWLRIVYDITVRHVTDKLNSRQLRVLQPSTLSRYTRWSRKHKQPVTIEDTGYGGKLLWVGEKRTDRVILFFHGGGFMAHLDIAALRFMRRIQVRLAEASLPVGLALLDYSLAPDHNFPTQLLQANGAIAHLFASGVAPENLQIIGDSAGANLILQVFSHTLHPITPSPSDSQVTSLSHMPPIPPSPLAPSLRGDAKPLLGVLLSSPWVNLAGVGGSFQENNKKDVVCADAYATWGKAYLDKMPPDLRAYADTSLLGKAPPATPSSDLGSASTSATSDGAGEWFADLPRLVSRIFITAGDHECFRDDILTLYDILTPLSTSSSTSSTSVPKPSVAIELKVEPEAGHDEHFFGFDGNEDRVGDGTKEYVEWFKRGFKGVDFEQKETEKVQCSP